MVPYCNWLAPKVLIIVIQVQFPVELILQHFARFDNISRQRVRVVKETDSKFVGYARASSNLVVVDILLDVISTK